MRSPSILVAMLVVALLASVLPAWTPAMAQEASPAADCPVTTEEENQAIVQRFYDVVGAGDPDELAEVLAPVVHRHTATGTVARSIEELRTGLANETTAFPDMQFEVEQWLTDDEFVVVRSIRSGTHLGDHAGIPPTGTSVTWTANSIYRIECGRITDVWVDLDSFGLLAQLGAFAMPGAATQDAATPDAAAAASPPAECPATTEEENEALVRRWFDEVYSQQNYANIDDFVAADHMHRRPAGMGGDTVGVDARQAALQRLHTAFSDVQVMPDLLVSDGDWVAARATVQATHEGSWGNLPATGNPVMHTATVLYRFECGRIAEEWLEIDGLAFFEQIGHIEWPAAASPAAG